MVTTFAAGFIAVEPGLPCSTAEFQADLAATVAVGSPRSELSAADCQLLEFSPKVAYLWPISLHFLISVE